MYQIGDKVLYGTHGVCVVAQLEQREIDHKQVVYMVLEPVGQPGSRFLVPTHNAAAMAKIQPLLSREALEALLHDKSLRENVWIPEEAKRKQHYRELLLAGNRESLLQMMYSVHCQQLNRAAEKKKVHMCDENFLHDAEKLLCSELATVLDMPTMDAKKYLWKKLKEDA